MEAQLIELYDTLERQPSDVHTHERLLKVWGSLGEERIAFEVASALIGLDPGNAMANEYFRNGPRVKTAPERSSVRHRGFDRAMQEDWLSSERSLEEGYTSLKFDAKLLREEIEAVNALGRISLKDEELLTNLQAISQGRVSTAISTTQPLPVREVARGIMTTPNRCQELIVEDFEGFARWAIGQTPPLQPDTIRERLIKRKTLLEAALPDNMQQFSIAALAHIEREFLQKKYVNSETMLGDRVEDIPKGNFFVSEDNYAWDMDELAQAISSNDGVMRNPLSKEMFSESDIRLILAHPLGQRLRPLQLAQSQLKKGVRHATIVRIDKLGQIMLNDQTVDAAPSRKAIDEFLANVVTLPEQEQKTIKSLKIPAKDRNGQPFDYTVGESVRDAIANTTCFHKVGDFLSQAAAYLRNN